MARMIKYHTLKYVRIIQIISYVWYVCSNFGHQDYHYSFSHLSM